MEGGRNGRLARGSAGFRHFGASSMLCLLVTSLLFLSSLAWRTASALLSIRCGRACRVELLARQAAALLTRANTKTMRAVVIVATRFVLLFEFACVFDCTLNSQLLLFCGSCARLRRLLASGHSPHLCLSVAPRAILSTCTRESFRTQRRK